MKGPMGSQTSPKLKEKDKLLSKGFILESHFFFFQDFTKDHGLKFLDSKPFISAKQDGIYACFDTRKLSIHFPEAIIVRMHESPVYSHNITG